MLKPSITSYRPSPWLIHLAIGLTNTTFAFTLATLRPALIPAIFAVVLTWVYFAAVVCAPKPHSDAADAQWCVGTVAHGQITPLFVLKFTPNSIVAILYLNIVVILWLATLIIFIVRSAQRPRFIAVFPTIISGAQLILMSYILARAANAWFKERETIFMETDQQNLFNHREQGESTGLGLFR